MVNTPLCAGVLYSVHVGIERSHCVPVHDVICYVVPSPMLKIFFLFLAYPPCQDHIPIIPGTNSLLHL